MVALISQVFNERAEEYVRPTIFAILAEDSRIIVFVKDVSSKCEELTFSAPQHGIVDFELIEGTREANVVYTPNPDYNGDDSFVLIFDYRCNDDVVITQDVVLTITPVDEPATSIYQRGTATADLIDLSTATNRVLIAGLDGNDTLRGGTCNDALNGGAGADVISGGAGNDLVTGGTGADRMSGGQGNDTFLIARGDLNLSNNTDLNVDFQGAGVAGGDVIRFTGFGAGASLEQVGTQANARVYEVHDAEGLNLGRLLVSAGGSAGTALAAGDYAFA